MPYFIYRLFYQLLKLIYYNDILELDEDVELKQLYKEFGTESIVPVLTENKRKLYKQIITNPKLYADAFKPMKDTRYRFLVIPGEKVPKDVKVKGSQLREDRKLIEYLVYTIEKRKDLTSYFIFDDKLERYVGFISYYQDKKTKSVIGIKIVRFDKDGDIRKDIFNLLNDLIEKNNLVYWEAILDDENPVIKPYKIYLEKTKKRKGYKTSYKETVRLGQKIAQYMIKTNS